MSYSGISGFEATEMIILNAVPSNQFDTSSALCTLVDGKGYFTKNHALTTVRCDTAEILLAAFRAISQRAAQGARPIIHIDGHSSANSLSIPSGEMVGWEIIYSHFRTINIETKNNLFVSIGACEALQSFRRATISQPCPFNALLAAWDPILESIVQVGIETFYDVLFTTSGNVDAALGALRQAVDPCPLKFYSSKDYLERGLTSYVKNSCVGDGLKARIESIIEQARKQALGRLIDMEAVNSVMEKEVRDTPVTLRRMAARFLHINGSETNAKRFAPDLEAVLADIQSILDSDRKLVPSK
jgi:hypothetical protein